METSMKAGGIAAFIQALCYLCGFAMIATVLNPGDTGEWNQARKLAFVLEHQTLFQLWNILLYIVFGIALVVLAVTLHALLKPASPYLLSITTPFALIWAGLVIASGMVANVGLDTIATINARNVSEAVEAWQVIGAIQDGLGGGVELVGGVWVLLLSIAALRSGTVLPRSLNFIGLVVGTCGILTLVPGLGALGAVFGLSQIAWFIFLGVVLLKTGAGAGE